MDFNFLESRLKEEFSDLIDRFFIPIDDPTSRLFYLNIVIAVLFIILWTFFICKENLFYSVKKIIFNHKYWWNQSTRTDYKIYFMNALLKAIILIPLFDLSFTIARQIIILFSNIYVIEDSIESNWINLTLFSICYFVYDDFLRFIHHLLMHKYSFLWQFHKTHHSARILTPITLYRTHPIEVIIAILRNSLSLGLTTGVFVYLFQSQLTVITIFGTHFMGFIFNFLGSNLRHSHIPISFGKIEYIFISPFQHQIHHSTHPEHHNSNFGVSLSIWDQINGSFILSQKIKNKKLRFGL